MNFNLRFNLSDWIIYRRLLYKKKTLRSSKKSKRIALLYLLSKTVSFELKNILIPLECSEILYSIIFNLAHLYCASHKRKWYNGPSRNSITRANISFVILCKKTRTPHMHASSWNYVEEHVSLFKSGGVV